MAGVAHLNMIPFQRMDSVATQDVLPIYSSSSSKPLQLLPTSSVRRRRFIVALLLFAGLIYLFFGNFRLVRQDSLQVPLLPDHPDPRPTVALSPLGLEAEESYHLGSLSLSDYKTSLQAFIDTAFPSPLKARLSKQLHRFLDSQSSEPLPELPKVIWQTNDVLPVNWEVQSWRHFNPDHEYRFLHDDEAEEWVQQYFKDSAIEWTWNNLPHAVMKADFLRYLLLLVEGGIYSDMCRDTECLKPIAQWGSGADIRQQLGTNGSPPGTIVGVEADVGDRADWHDWWSRPLQIVQWTMLSSPGHPVFLDTIRRIYAKTVEVKQSLSDGIKIDSKGNINKTTSILEWTGPAVFTDATLRFLRIETDLRWVDLRGLEKPLQAGSVTILPVTGFSPDVGNFGAKSKTDEQAMVKHTFHGSWKPPSGSQ